MASIRKQIVVAASPDAVWAAARDVGALHERLVPGFVVATRLEPGARVVTFANGAVVREPIVTIDDNSRRLVWSAQGGRATHYNAALEIFADAGGSRIVWTADFLPDSLAGDIAAAMDKGLAAMKTALAR